MDIFFKILKNNYERINKEDIKIFEKTVINTNDCNNYISLDQMFNVLLYGYNLNDKDFWNTFLKNFKPNGLEPEFMFFANDLYAKISMTFVCN